MPDEFNSVENQGEPQLHRAPWGAFPDIPLVASQSKVKKHPDYEQAKQGDVNEAAPAAKRLALSLVNAGWIASLRQWPLAGARLVPVHALEGQGYNRIPAAFAELIAERLDLEIETGIIQVNVVNHTGANGWQRMARAALFEGAVHIGMRYVLVDDFVGLGGTLANLRGHIVHHGGSVIGAVCLTGREDSAKLALTIQTLEALRQKYGEALEAWWIEAVGFDFSCLTESEARYLLRVETADAVRAQFLAARSEGHG
jgi:hypothetical protein